MKLYEIISGLKVLAKRPQPVSADIVVKFIVDTIRSNVQKEIVKAPLPEVIEYFKTHNVEDYVHVDAEIITFHFPSVGFVSDNIILPGIKNAVNFITQKLPDYGWFVLMNKVQEGSYRFTASPNYNKRVQLSGNVLYHTAPTKYKDSILKRGLLPRKNQNDSIHRQYPARIYVANNLTIVKEFMDFVKNVPTTIFAIDVSKLPKGIKFYYDPEYFEDEGAYYTYTPIPASALSVHSETFV